MAAPVSNGPPWVRIPEQVYGGRLSASAVAVYCTLAAHADRTTGHAWPSQCRLAEQTGLSDKTVRRCLAELVRHRVIVTSRHYRGGLTRNRYALLAFPSGGYVMLPRHVVHDLPPQLVTALVRWLDRCGPEGSTTESVEAYGRRFGEVARNVTRNRSHLVTRGLLTSQARPGRASRTEAPSELHYRRTDRPSGPLTQMTDHPRHQRPVTPDTDDRLTRDPVLETQELENDPPPPSRSEVTSAREAEAAAADKSPQDEHEPPSTSPTPDGETAKLLEQIEQRLPRGLHLNGRDRDELRQDARARLDNGWTFDELVATAVGQGFEGVRRAGSVIRHRLGDLDEHPRRRVRHSPRPAPPAPEDSAHPEDAQRYAAEIRSTLRANRPPTTQVTA